MTSRLLPCVSVPSHQCFGSTLSWPTICGSSRLPGLIEGEGDLALAGLLRLGDMAVISRIVRMVLLERLEREDHVLRRHRLAVVPFRFRRAADSVTVEKSSGIADALRRAVRIRSRPRQATAAISVS